ncbi:uncharacterized protein BDZ99DRAFT_519227 [Mytilinidion resinicola]|uniref:Mannosyl-glycoprotein endo-beta-N-acetylglucosaminidase n=1 Tax=Mytilinidion resinicola TaxID=574789 RepID=A0A6A6YVP7_9PEZI|nr:uncharacterized protein BDZ99DRAFT_519227 [Mytilinidion resinicola]KAF2811987.1 hypothetical protein BDZ99DRAFT_519227 [Mytilinidion resinicola]
MNTHGWKDILRPIRDGFRHYFPSPDTGPTPEERYTQQKLDALKGFTYFDTFNQLEDWTLRSSDHIQRANTPLLPRPTPAECSASPQSASVLLCHDYGGNYHDYESSQGVGIDEESYSCEYLQFVEAFVYFSHKLVCVPPPSWTNTLHRNGVKVLGTFLVEPALRENNRMLENSTVIDAEGAQLHFPFASKLAAIAEHYGFDGWLINIEKPFDKSERDLNLLMSFLRQLRSTMGAESRVIWYDALTVSNKVVYQNGLSLANLPYTQACDGILTNYCWTEDKAVESRAFAQQHEFLPENVYFGVDVWAQNSSKLSNLRVTYPEKGGGGTHTGIAVSKLAETGLSVGIFAPAWSFEHFTKQRRAVEQAMWDGEPLTEEPDCPCDDQPHGGRSYPVAHQVQPYPVTRSARLYPAGSKSFFYTNFSRAFASHSPELEDVYGGKRLHSQLGSQSVLPHSIHRHAVLDDDHQMYGSLHGELLDHPSRLAIYHEFNETMRPLRLFTVNMPADGTLQIRMSYKNYRISGTTKLGLMIGSKYSFVDLRGGSSKIETVQIMLRDPLPEGIPDSPRLSEISLLIEAGDTMNSHSVGMEIFELSITPLETPRLSSAIVNIRVETRGKDEEEHRRLMWDYQDQNMGLSQSVPRHLPYSQLTGPFAYFSIEVDGDDVGRAYATEYILCDVLVGRLRRDAGAKFRVIGVGFDELFARLAKQGVTSPDTSGQAPHYHQPSVSSPVYSPAPSGPQPHHQSAVMSPNSSVNNTPTPGQSSSDKTASLLSLLRFNGPGALSQASASERRPSQQSVQNLSMAEGQGAHGRTTSASDLVASFMRKPSQGASRSSAAASPAPSGRAEHAPPATEAPQDLLLRLLNHPKPPQNDLPALRGGKSASAFSTATLVDDPTHGYEDAKLETFSSGPAGADTESPIRVFGDSKTGDSTFEAPQAAPKPSMFTYVNPFEQLSAATPRNRTPVPERANNTASPRNRTPLPERANTTASPRNRTPLPDSSSASAPTRKMEILKPKHGRAASSGADGKENGSEVSGPASKTRKLSPGATSHFPTHNPHETVSEAVSGIGEQVDKQVEEALAQADKQSNGNGKAKAEAKEVEELELAMQDAAISIKKELEDPETRRDMEEALPKPMADALKEVVEEVAQADIGDADVVDSWESAEAEDSPAKDEEQQIQVFKFPMRAFAAITVNKSLSGPSFRSSAFMDVARLKKEFDQIDRCLVTATKLYIVYALGGKTNGFRIIRQDNGQYRQVFQNYKERIFNLATCSAPAADLASSQGAPETILGIGVNGAVFWTAVNTKDDVIELVQDHSIIFPPAATQDDNTSGGQLKTRAKPSCRHPEYFAVGRGKAIHIIFPNVARSPRYTDPTTQICNTEAYLKDRPLKILTGKAGKDFAFSEDDTVIASLDKAGRMRFWDIRPLTLDHLGEITSEIDPVEIREPILEHHTTSTNVKSWPTSVFFFDKERPCVKGIALRYVMVGMKQNHSFQLWDLGLGKPVQEINLPHEKESDAICSVSFHPRTGILAVGHPTRNSVFFIHVSCPRYNLQPMSQASYIAQLAKKETSVRPLPAVNATAIMTSIHEYSFSSKGQLRSLQMLNDPVSSAPDDAKPQDKPRFELYVMQSKGVSVVAVRQADLGWKNDGEALYPVDAEKAGVAVVGTIKSIELSSVSEDTSAAGETPARKPGSDRSTRESVKKESSAATHQSLTPEAAMRASTLAKVESKQDAARAAIINGPEKPVEKVEKKKKKKDKSNTEGSQASAKVKESTATSSSASYAQAAQSASSPSPLPPSSDGSKSKALETEAPEWATRLLSQVLQHPTPASSAIAQPDVKKLEESISVEFTKILSKEVEALHKRIDTDNRAHVAAGSAKQEAILRLVSETLSQNVERSFNEIITKSVQTTLMPKLIDSVNETIDKELKQTLKKAIVGALPGELQAVLPSMSVIMQNQIQNPQFLGRMSDTISKKITTNFEAIVTSSLSATLGPALNSLTQVMENRFAEQSREAHLQRQKDAQKLEQLTKLVQGLAGTVQSMAASQESFHLNMLRTAEEARHSYGGGPGSASTSAPRTEVSPTKSQPQSLTPRSSLEETEEEINRLLQLGEFGEATSMWIRSSSPPALFESIFSRWHPDYLSTISPLYALSSAVVVTEPLNNLIVERLNWLEAALDSVDPRDPELQPDVVPSIMQIITERLTAAYHEFNTPRGPGQQVLRKILALANRVNDFNRLATGGRNVRH